MLVKPTTLEELLVRLFVTVDSDVPLVPMSPAVEVRLTFVPDTVPAPEIDVPLMVLLAPETVPLTATAPPAAIAEDVVPFTKPVAPTVVPAPDVMETVSPLNDPLMVSLVPAPSVNPLVAFRTAPALIAVLVPELKLIMSALVVLPTVNKPLVDSFNVPCAPTVEFSANEPVLAM